MQSRMREEDGMFIIMIDSGSEVLVNEYSRKVVFIYNGVRNEHKINLQYDLSKASIATSEIRIPKRGLNEGSYKQLLHD